MIFFNHILSNTVRKKCACASIIQDIFSRLIILTSYSVSNKLLAWLLAYTLYLVKVSNTNEQFTVIIEDLRNFCQGLG